MPCDHIPLRLLGGWCWPMGCERRSDALQHHLAGVVGVYARLVLHIRDFKKRFRQRALSAVSWGFGVWVNGCCMPMTR